MARERGGMVGFVLVVLAIIAIIVVGIVQLLIPGDSDDDERGHVRVEVAKSVSSTPINSPLTGVVP